MSKVISIVTTSSIGIWNIPMRGQNFINNHFDNKLSNKFHNEELINEFSKIFDIY